MTTTNNPSVDSDDEHRPSHEGGGESHDDGKDEHGIQTICFHGGDRISILRIIIRKGGKSSPERR